ncbi:MAG: bile acid:sodium symporter family protein [Agriterribacter sp.]
MYGTSFIFFFYGVRLNMQKLWHALSNWRMHMLVQSTTFVLFPLVALLLLPFFPEPHHTLWLGIFYLCALPSTVSSSVVMVSIAGGNIPAAIFNASISTMIGVFLTPLWMIPFIQSTNSSVHSADIILKLILQVMVPVVAGLLLHKRLGAFAEKYKKQLRYFDQGVILLIIYSAFCHSFYTHAFDGYSILSLLYICIGSGALFFLVFFIVKSISRLLKFNREDSITVLFCGSKKSLVHGTVMSKVLFPASPAVSIILLPIMIYHALQLIFVSILAQQYSRHSKPNQ